MRKAGNTAAVLLAVATLLAGCFGLPPVYPGAIPGTYKVKQGDTLYSISFRFGLDYKSMARINGISPPYTIYVNQVLRLRGSARQPEKDWGPAVVRKQPKTSQPPRVKLPEKISDWRWPLEGKVISEFSLANPVNKGIDIAGRAGCAVVAAADGVVVYAGGNLRGYGKLVIIKHSENFLSAYGNNQDMQVTEGQAVKAGRSIARVGTNAADVDMLHFEIRRDGKPEDPRKYLPAR